MMSMLQLCLSIGLLLAILKFLKSYLEWYRSPLWAIPGPPFRIASWFLGQLPVTIKEPFMEPHKRWWKQAGGGRPGTDGATTDADFIHFCFVGGSHRVIVTNADVVRQILMANAGRDPRYLKKLDIIVSIVGWGLLSLEGEDWQRHRRVVHPSFRPRFVKDSLERVVPDLVSRFISQWRRAEEGREIDVMEHFSTLALDVLGRVAFSHDFHALDSVSKWADGNVGADVDGLSPVTDRMVQALRALFTLNTKKLVLNVFGLSKLDWETQRTRKALNDAVDDIIQKVRSKVETTVNEDADDTNSVNKSNAEEEDSSSSTKKSKYAPTSLLGTLLDAKDSGTDKTNDAKGVLNDAELRDEVKTFIVAGHETTSTWCYWCTFALCKHPDVQQKVYDDIMKHAPIPVQSEESTSHENDATIPLEALEKMQYLDAFMKEVLRLYPPAGLVIRNTTRDETFGNTLIPANTGIIIPILILHQDPRYWSRPDEFRPERWLDENGGPRYPASHKYAYLPFSAGPRNCIGQQFATTETKLIMAPIIRAFVFQLAPSLRDKEFTFTTYITMKAKPAVKVCIRSRSTLQREV